MTTWNNNAFIMNRTVTLILFIVTFWMTSCNKDDDLSMLLHDSKLQTKLQCATDMAAYQNKVFVADIFSENNLLWMINFGTKKIERGFFPRSSPIGDFSQLNSLDVNRNSIFAYDVVSGIIGEYPHDITLTKFGELQASPSPTTHGYTINKVFDKYVMSGKFLKYKYLLYDSTRTHLVGRYCDYLKKPRKDIYEAIHATANFGKSIFIEEDSVLANIVYIAGIVSFYKYDNNGIHLINQYVVSDMDYEVKNNSYISDKMGFLSITASSKYIYALYSGNEVNRNSPYEEGDKLYVFDHKGNYIRHFKLDLPFTAISVDKVTGHLYSVSQKDRVLICRYDNIDQKVQQ